MVFFKRRGKPQSLINYVEYIESTGTQYIDTGFKPTQNTRIVFCFNTLADKEGWYFGLRRSTTSNDRFSCLFPIGAEYIRTDFASTNTTTTFSPSGIVTIDKDKNVTKINSQSYTSPNGTFTSTYNLYLFCGNNGGVMFNNISIQLFYCKIYDNGILVRDYLPAKNEDGVVCLYDRHNKEYVYNAGSGQFIAGPEL